MTVFAYQSEDISHHDARRGHNADNQLAAAPDRVLQLEHEAAPAATRRVVADPADVNAAMAMSATEALDQAQQTTTILRTHATAASEGA